MKDVSMKKIINRFFYALIDFLTLYKGVPRNINGFKVRFPARWSRYYLSDYEKETFEFFKKNIRKGNTVLDIGAHIGLYSSPFAEMVGAQGSVFCFEPTPSTYGILKKTMQLNKHRNVKGVNAAISETSGTITFNLTSKNGEGSNANSIVSIDRSVTNVEVKAISIDDFRKENKLKINVLKIDVEGAELSALKGAKETFMQDRPLGILALHPSNIIEFGHSLEGIWKCLEEYKLKIFYQGQPISKDDFCNNELLFDIEFIPA
jgi:FkbM family methyltransferase